MPIPLQTITFGAMVVVAVGTAIYYYFANNPNNMHSHDESVYGELPHHVPPVSSVDDRRRSRRKTNDNPRECSICLDTLKISKTRSLCCGHIFHDRCVSKWISSQQPRPTCPVCRRSVL
uniref:RING-type domain-containing protein n=1 Tax=Photinus pyralis TaxID=7054 RepID=A0A1Y1NHE7_PHOPY